MSDMSSDEDLPDDFVMYAHRKEWADVKPLKQSNFFILWNLDIFFLLFYCFSRRWR